MYKDVGSGCTVSKQTGLFRSIPEKLGCLAHIEAARRLRFEEPQCQIHAVQAAAAWHARVSIHTAQSRRRAAIEKWAAVADRAKASGRHDPLHSFCVDAVRALDSEFDLLGRGSGRGELDAVRVVVDGAPMSGCFADEQLFAAADPPPPPPRSVSEMLLHQKSYRGEVLHAIEKFTAADRIFIWESTWEDISGGRARVVPDPSRDSSPAAYYMRFVQESIKQDKLQLEDGVPRGDPATWVRKRRCCDDGTANLVSITASTLTPITCCTLDRFALTAKLFVEECIGAGYGGEFDGFTADHRAAYRTVRASNSAFMRVVPILRPGDGCVFIIEYDVLLFAEEASVLAYNSVARVACMIVCRVLGIPLDHYYDDLVAPAKA